MFEEDITMFGNRYRKLLEKLLKFFILSEKIMFQNNYEKDMLGNILEQMKKFTQTNDFRFFFKDKEKNTYCQIIEIVENNLIENLNKCSHDNVREKISFDIVIKIYTYMEQLINLIYIYYNFEVNNETA